MNKSALAIVAAIGLAPVHARAQQSYSKVLEEADAAYGSSGLSLSPDGRWLAMVLRDSVIVLPSGGGGRTRVPLPGLHACGVPVWNEQSTSLAIACTPARVPGQGAIARRLYVWRRGDPSVRTAASAAQNVVGWLPTGRRILYVTSAPAPAVPVIASRPRTEPRDSAGSCVPASVNDVTAVISVTCSDTADVMRSAIVKRLLASADERLAYRRNESKSGEAPDTTRFAYRSRVQIRIAELDRDTTMLLHLLPSGSFHELTILGDGSRIGIVQADSLGRRQGRGASWYSVFTLSAGDTARRRVVDPADLKLWTKAARAWSPDGSAFAWRPGESLDTARADTIHIASTVGAPPVTIVLRRPVSESERLGVQRPGMLSAEEDWPAIRWTPDGTRIVASVRGRLWLLDRRGGSPRLLSDRAPRTDRAPRIDVAGALLVADAEALVTTLDPATGLRGIWWVGLDDASWRKVTDLAQSLPTNRIVARQRAATATLAYVASSRSAPQNVYTLQLSGAGGTRVKRQQLTDARVAIPLPAVRDTVLSYAVTTTVTAHARLIRPAGATGPLPTIVYGYPGGLSPLRYAYLLDLMPGSFDPYAAIARGYAFLHVDVPVTPWGIYGERGVAANIVAAFEAALAASARSGWVDTTRLGVVGHSFGGFMVNTLVARMPDRFQAAVSMAGMSNYVSSIYGGSSHGSSYFPHMQGSMEAEFTDDPLRYLENSPIRYLEQVRTPLLLLHGVQDPFVSVSQSEEMFRGLAQLGRPVEFVRYQKSGHGPDEGWWERTLDWFDAFLR